MAAFVNVLKAVALAAFSFMCIVIGLAVLQVQHQAKQIAANANIAINSIAIRANLTLKNLDYLVLNAGTTVALARRASIKEIDTLDVLNRQLVTTVANTNKTLLSTNAAIQTLTIHSTAMLDASAATVAQVQPVLEQTTTTMKSLNALIADPGIPATIGNIQSTTATLGDIAKHSDAMVVDTEKVWHKFLHPTWTHRVWSLVTGAGLKIAPIVVH